MQGKLAQGSFLLLLLIVTLVFVWVLTPFVGAILWAAITAILFHPLQRRLAKKFNGRENLLAATVLLISTVSVVLPLLGVIAALTQEGANLYAKVEAGEIDVSKYIDGSGSMPPVINNVLARLGVEITEVQQAAKNASLQASRYLATQALGIGQNITQFVVSFALMLYLTFFFLRDGTQLIQLLIKALPLGDTREKQMLQKISEMVDATIRGNLAVAAIQGFLGGMIFWILGVQVPLLWGVTMMLLSLLPAVGAALIWGPVAIYFLLTDSIWQGIVLIVFGAGVIGLVDNVLRPILVGRKTQMPDYLILLSTLGGISIFGLHGFVVGPLVATLFISVWSIFIREFNPS